MHDPKYRFGSRTACTTGRAAISCRRRASVLFRGKDVGTLVALRAYRRFMEHVSTHADTPHARSVARAHAESIAERLDAITEFQRENPDRTGLGCHTCPPGVDPHDIGELVDPQAA